MVRISESAEKPLAVPNETSSHRCFQWWILPIESNLMERSRLVSSARRSGKLVDWFLFDVNSHVLLQNILQSTAFEFSGKNILLQFKHLYSFILSLLTLLFHRLQFKFLSYSIISLSNSPDFFNFP